VTVLPYQPQWLSLLYFCGYGTKWFITLEFYCVSEELYVWCLLMGLMNLEMVGQYV